MKRFFDFNSTAFLLTLPLLMEGCATTQDRAGGSDSNPPGESLGSSVEKVAMGLGCLTVFTAALAGAAYGIPIPLPAGCVPDETK